MPGSPTLSSLVARPLRAARRRVRTPPGSFAGWLRGAWLTWRYVDERDAFPAIRFHGPRLTLRIEKARGARLAIRGTLVVSPWLGGRGPSSIKLGEDARIDVAGEYSIGDDVQIAVEPGGRLSLGGRRVEPAAGITARGVVLVREDVRIGHDCLIAWDTLVTDCDWHHLDGTPESIPTVIGDHVWLATGVRVLKGARIGADSVVAAGATVLAGEYPARSLLAGTPARAAAQPVAPWRRDLDPRPGSR